MNAPSRATCPACGGAAAGRFCSECGASLAAPTCAVCGAETPPRARFCSGCGAPVGGSARAPGASHANAGVWVAAAGVVLVLGLAVVVWQNTSVRPPAGSPSGAPAPVTAGAPPDLSTMSPREQADRLFNRVMGAHERGDQQEVGFFAPMAVQAYGLLDSLDPDARYHVGLLHAVGGPIEAVGADADTLEASWPEHLFAPMLRATVARVRGDSLALRDAYRVFLDRYEAEIARNRQEYVDHRTSLDAFRRDAEAATDSGSPDT